METNLLKAIKNIVNLKSLDVSELYYGNNRMNDIGTALEYFIKDMFCSSLDIQGISQKDKEHSKFLSYSGNQNNPPDFMLKNGDAVEVKKYSNGNTRGISLNSSYPKDYLHADSPLISAACRTCEVWSKKDIIYSIGQVYQGKIKSLWFIYGNCYSADKQIYERIKDTIKEGINSLPDIEFGSTKELGRVNEVDPLGITYLRIRGMWGIKHPSLVFTHPLIQTTNEFSMNAIMLESKYNSFPTEDIKNLELLDGSIIAIDNIEIRSPNNPAKYLNGKIISFNK